ncbi:MAG TPA: hypothetical protein VKG79_03000 [Bryobacteraceae bacterium]|nr:hypothetical protein [Bryobacteraceae bacterium]
MRYIVVLGLAAMLPLLAQSPFYSEQQYQLGHSVFESLLNHLQAAESSAPPSLVATARAQVQDLSKNWEKAIYRHRQIDDVIDSLETITNRTVSVREQANLGADVSRLLDLRREYY